jgi:hypothetical protein
VCYELARKGSVCFDRAASLSMRSTHAIPNENSTKSKNAKNLPGAYHLAVFQLGLRQIIVVLAAVTGEP